MVEGGRKKAAAKRKTAAKKTIKKVHHYRVRKDGSKGTLKKSQLTKNKSGKVVSKKKRELGKKQYKKNLKPWNDAVKRARKELGITGFKLIKKGTKLYKLAKKYQKK